MYEYKNYMSAFVFKEQQLLMKVNLINVHQLIILTLIINTLSGCYNKKEFKRVIQDGFDSARKKANVKGDFAFIWEL